MALLELYYTRLRAELERHGGTVEKYIGDAIVTHFGVPVAHEDDPERAVRAALDILDTVEALNAEDPIREIKVRIGVATGEVIVTHGQKAEEGKGIAWGDVLNTAARIESAAPVNGILVGEETYRATAHRIDYREHEPIEAKGKDKPVPVWQAVGVQGDPGAEPCRRRAARRPRGRARAAARALGRRAQRRPSRRSRRSSAIRASARAACWASSRTAPRRSATCSGDAASRTARASPTGRSRRCSRAPPASSRATTPRRCRPSSATLLDRFSGARSRRVPHRRRHARQPRRRRRRERRSRRADVAGRAPLGHPPGLRAPGRGAPARARAGGHALGRADAVRPDRLRRRGGRADPRARDRRGPSCASCAPLSAWRGSGVRCSRCPRSARSTARPCSPALLGDRKLPPGGRAETLLRNAAGNPLFLEETVRMLDDAGVFDGTGDLSELAVPTSLQAMIGSRLDGLPGEDKSVANHASVVGMTFWSRAVAELHGAGAVVDPNLEALEQRDFVRGADGVEPRRRARMELQARADPGRRLRPRAEGPPREPARSLRRLDGEHAGRSRRAGRDPRVPPRAGVQALGRGEERRAAADRARRRTR